MWEFSGVFPGQKNHVRVAMLTQLPVIALKIKALATNLLQFFGYYIVQKFKLSIGFLRAVEGVNIHTCVVRAHTFSFISKIISLLFWKLSRQSSCCALVNCRYLDAPCLPMCWRQFANQGGWCSFWITASAGRTELECFSPWECLHKLCN